MAPEVLRGQSADARSDLWALGVHALRDALRQIAVCKADTVCPGVRDSHEEPAPLPPRVPAGFRAVVQRCLTKSRDGAIRARGRYKRRSKRLNPLRRPLRSSERGGRSQPY